METPNDESGDNSLHSKVHCIRLRGPWHVEALECCGGELPRAARLKLPSDWGPAFGDEFRGRVRFRRSFGRPTELEPNQTVWLVFDAVRSRAVVSLAGESLGSMASSPVRFDVTSRLDERNELIVDVEHSPADIPDLPGGLIGEVRLEIEEDEFDANHPME